MSLERFSTSAEKYQTFPEGFRRLQKLFRRLREGFRRRWKVFNDPKHFDVSGKMFRRPVWLQKISNVSGMVSHVSEWASETLQKPRGRPVGPSHHIYDEIMKAKCNFEASLRKVVSGGLRQMSPGRSGAMPVESEASRDALELRLSSLRRLGTLWSYACRV